MDIKLSLKTWSKLEYHFQVRQALTRINIKAGVTSKGLEKLVKKMKVRTRSLEASKCF